MFVNYQLHSPFVHHSNADENTTFKKIDNNIPKINSAIATYPFCSKLVENTIDKNCYKDELQYVSTYNAYQDIIDNLVDFSIASETNHVQKEILENTADIKLIPFAKEALVFYVNKNNPISTLTIEDLNNIYSEEITNWNKLGENDIPISPYQLKKDVGGSEECFSQVVKNNSTYNNDKFIAYDMKNIIDLTSDTPGGIGYAFNMFCSELYNLKSIKKLSINNISPTYENIVSKKYPLMFNVYFIYRESNNNPNIQNILNWLLSDEGQIFVSKCGFQPINN